MITVVTTVLLLTLLSLAVATVPDSTGLVPTAAFSGVTGIVNVLLAPAVIEAGLLHDITVPDVVQLKPLLVKLAGTVRLPGTVSVKVTGPVVGAEPILLIITGMLLV